MFKGLTGLTSLWSQDMAIDLGTANTLVVLKDQGKLEEAIEAYNKVISISPKFADAYNNMGTALKTQGKLEEAIEVFRKALSVQPDHAAVYINMGICSYNITFKIKIISSRYMRSIF